MIFPSHEEGYGMAVAEALANGCRVVSYDLPVFKKEFGDSIVRVPCYNLEIFAEKVIEYFECSDEENIEPQAIRSWEQASKEEFEIIIKQFAT
jgi:glycosyltransferase involved in cell wall biosynthesis